MAVTIKHAKVIVNSWNFSHFTGNGNSVYNFTITTDGGKIIAGKTLPGLASGIGRNPSKLGNVSIRQTDSGRIKMIEAQYI